MKLKIDLNKLNEHPRNFIRRCGYGEIFDYISKKTSYVRRLSASYHYPRFHLYYTVENDILILDMHLDEKKARYEGQKAHNAQYDSPQVKEELFRIASFVNSSSVQSSHTNTSTEKGEKKTLFQRLFKK